MKKIIIALSALLLMAFDAGQKEKTVTITFTVSQANTVIKALVKLPYEESAPIIATIQMQAEKQLSDTAKRK